MEPRAVGKEKFFIVTRGKSRKGFSRGCIGRVEAETQMGEVLGQQYHGSSSSHVGTPKRGMVRTEDTYPLTRHQAQLLLFVPTPAKRLELLCSPQLFSAICELAQDDLVVVKYKKGHLPALVKNLMQIGRKEDAEDLHMLGFQVEFVDRDQSSLSKKPAPLPLFSAADIVEVVPGHSVPFGLHQNTGALSRKTASHVSSSSNARKSEQSETCTDRRVPASRSPAPPDVRLERGSMVEVASNVGVVVYGVIRWTGVPAGRTDDWAGIELEDEVKRCSDGTYGGQRYFSCKAGRALFVPLTKCSPDGRFLRSFTEKMVPPAPDLPTEDLEEDAPPIPESQALSLLVGRMRGIQGHFNSCYLDATLFSLFCSSTTLDTTWHEPADQEHALSQTLRKEIVNRLRRQGFVPAECVMRLRKQLGCNTFLTEEKDPEEFITVLLQKTLGMKPLLKLRSNGETCQEAYTFQIILEKEQVGKVPTVQQLLDTSFLSCDLKFEEVPSCLILQMPRFGKKYKMFPHIIPSTELDVTDLLHGAPRECFICGQPAVSECLQCFADRKLQPGKIKQYCSVCNTQVHAHPSRQSHTPTTLPAPAESTAGAPVSRHTMQLFAVLCIQTSHYVSFVKYGPDPHAWLFFDSMADRCGDDQSGYNIPEVTACPELGDFLSGSEEEEVALANPSQASEPVRRLLCDSYMFFYHSPAAPLRIEDRHQLHQPTNGQAVLKTES